MSLMNKMGIIIALAFFSFSAFAKEKSLDPLVVGKGMYSLKIEDADFRVMEVTFKPGQKMGLHQHPKHVVYAVTPGTLKIYTEGKDPVEANLKAGDVMITPAEKHWGQNIGSSPLTLLVIELKAK